ncbi:MAG: hypothetical protein LBR79_05990 [Oscillospiraceae bacterium]|nr:hypothetical protein [Oscillospiraceae bacterium]
MFFVCCGSGCGSKLINNIFHPRHRRGKKGISTILKHDRFLEEFCFIICFDTLPIHPAIF